MSDIDLNFIRQNAAKALESSTVQYLRNAQLRGSLIEEATDGSISVANTEYFIDHEEPNAILRYYVEKKQWPLGTLKKGHELAVVIHTPSHALISCRSDPRSRHFGMVWSYVHACILPGKHS